MRRVNLHRVDITYDDGRPAGYRTGTARMGPAIGADRVSATVYELPPGESTWPYHFEHGAEEWLLVLDGRPTLRHPHGEDELEPGDVVCFPDGPEGAHKLTNRSDGTARLMILSTTGRPAVAVFPDSDKLGVWPDGGEPILVRREPAGYWDGES